jgi:Dynamin family
MTKRPVAAKPPAVPAPAAVPAPGPEPAQAPDPAVSTAQTLVTHVRDAARAHRRPDLDARVQIALDRLDRPDVVVCVAGEFKQGKSSLINALLGVAACPVDDDLATAAVTVVRHGAALDIKVRRRKGPETVIEPVNAAELADYVTERGNPGNARGVELVDIRLPNRLLERGWSFIDTPGIGGLNRAQAAAALAFLPVADALLFVTDASAELTANELEFLARARNACPNVTVALTKTDLYPAWRRILALDGEHLAQRGVGAAPLPVSSVLRAAALQRADRDLNDESGIPALLERLQTDVVDTVRAGAVGRTVRDARGVVAQLRLPLEHELAGLRDPSRRAPLEAELAASRGQLQALRGPAARWSQHLNDGFGDLASGVDYQLRSSMRGILREAEEGIEASDPADAWDGVARDLQAKVAAAVGSTFRQLIEGEAAMRAELAQLIRDEQLAIVADDRIAGIDVADLWSGRPITRSTVQAGVGMGFGALRGAQSGVLMLGMLGNLFNLAVIGPALLGGAAIFAGKSILDERKRQLSQRRQEARVAVRQYVDDVQFEVGTRIRDLLRELQRELREGVSGRLEELQRTYGESSGRLEAALKEDAAARANRVSEIEPELAAFADLERRLMALVPPQRAAA